LRNAFTADKSGIVENDAHMTPLGIKFCQNIEEYRIESADERRGSQLTNVYENWCSSTPR
jgi:hypothetical protein